MKKRKRPCGAQIISGKKLLAMAHAAKRAKETHPEWYRDIRKMIRELRMTNDAVRHFRGLFWTQSVSLYRAAHGLSELGKNVRLSERVTERHAETERSTEQVAQSKQDQTCHR